MALLFCTVPTAASTASLGMPSRPRDASIGTSGTVQIARGSCSMGQYAVSRLSHDLPLPEGVGLSVHRASRVWF